MHRFQVVICLTSLISSGIAYADKPKILHLSYHLGTIKEFETVAQKLDLDVTSWFVFEQPLKQFEGQDSGYHVYNMLPDRAERIWNKHKDYFNQFNDIMTSDTAPLSRIFLQHDWQKPLIIWVCNRFDLACKPSSFPDEGLYKMFKEALNKENVFLIPWSIYEWFHCYKRGVRPQLPVIWPLGSEETKQRYNEPGWEDVMIYYDSWHDLKYKVETTDYDAMKKKIMIFARAT